MSKNTVKLNQKGDAVRGAAGRGILIAGLLLWSLALAGCGYKGPLTLPSSSTQAHLPVHQNAQ